MVTRILRLITTAAGIISIIFSIEYFLIECIPLLGLTLYTVGLFAFLVGARGIISRKGDGVD